jgi:hypothetical protein
MAITYIGEAGVAGGNQTTPQVISYASTTGNTLIMTGFLYFGNATVPGIASIVDSASNTWQYATNTSQNPPYSVDTTGGSGNSIIFVGWTINAAAVTNVTLNMVNSGPWTRISVVEWSGIAALDSCGSATSLSGTSPSTTLSLTTPNDLVIGACENDSGTSINLPAGWSSLASSGGTANNGYYFPGVSGSYSPTWTLGASADWGVAVAAFRPPITSNALLSTFP